MPINSLYVEFCVDYTMSVGRVLFPMYPSVLLSLWVTSLGSFGQSASGQSINLS